MGDGGIKSATVIAMSHFSVFGYVVVILVCSPERTCQRSFSAVKLIGVRRQPPSAIRVRRM